MQRSCILVAVLVIIGCGGEDKDDNSWTCEKEDRVGTYLAQYSTRGGNCGDIPDALVVLSGDPGAGGDCSVDSEEWSEGDCKLSRSVSCDFAADDQTMTMVMVSTQTDEDGDRLTGIVTATIEYMSTGGSVCSGTYDVVLDRQ